MNILWLPHAPLRVGRMRSDHIVERLAAHHQVTVASFRIHDPRRPWLYLLDLLTHRSRWGPPFDELAIHRIPKMTALNGWLLNRAIQRELSRRRYDVLVVAPAPYITGYLDFAAVRTRNVPVVCDYLDGIDWDHDTGQSAFERVYVRSADAVICVSRGLLRQALTVNPHAHYVPNGVELARYRAFAAEHTAPDCKASLGIDPDAYVISIIGMTCSPRLYFVDAVVNLARSGRKVVLLLVGASPLIPEIERRAGEWRHVVRAVGPVPYRDVLPYFMATDLGLSAVDEHSYYHFQSPLKIFEYGAMGKRVLAAPPVEEVAELGLPFVQFCGAASEDMTSAMMRIMSASAAPTAPDLAAFDWDKLTAEIEAIFVGVVARTGDRAGAARLDSHRTL